MNKWMYLYLYSTGQYKGAKVLYNKKRKKVWNSATKKKQHKIALANKIHKKTDKN